MRGGGWREVVAVSGGDTAMGAGVGGAVLGPSPSGALELSMRCWTSRAPGAPATRHRAVLGSGWSVEVPHDLAAERLASALGGWLSCLVLEERAIPAARRWLELATRAAPPPIVPLGHLGWTSASPLRCCPARGFESAEEAFDHVRDARHLGEQFGVDRKQVGDLIRPIGQAWAGHPPLSIPAEAGDRAACLLGRGERDVTALWCAGVHPARVVGVHTAIGVEGRLSARLVLAVLLRGPDLDWLGATLRVAGAVGELDSEIADEPADAPADLHPVQGGAEEPLAEWLARTQSDWDIADPTARGRWLALGVSRATLVQLAEAGYDPVELAWLAEGTGRSADGAARHLAGWLAAGVTPRVEHLLALHGSGRVSAWSVPSRAAVDRVRAEVGSRCRADRSTLAYLLALCGTVPDAVAAHRAGRSWRDVLATDHAPPSGDTDRLITFEEQESA